MSALYNSDAKFHPVRTTQKHFRLHIQKPFLKPIKRCTTFHRVRTGLMLLISS